MRGFFQLIALIGLLLVLTRSARAAENIGPGKVRQHHMRTTANCLPSSASAQLDINNVRCLLHNGGDMWWDLTGSPRYEIPKVDDPALARHSAFAASLWIGGIDDDQNLRVAAQTYRQSGNDFFPGPLTRTGGVTQDVCNEWDKMFKINKSEIDDFRAAFTAAANGGAPLVMSNFPAVASWPAFGYDEYGRVSLAPFVDVDGNDEQYSPQAGDYPDIRPIEGGGEPDQAIWWVINDKGDVHTETGGLAIGLEIQMMAFAFSTSNAINDMTFYKYKVINKSGQNIHDTFMGQWADVDLGYAKDDFVGCDTVRGLGYSYNADPEDESNLGGYGEHPPVFGIDFFQGPIDTNGQRLGMTKFMYYDNKDGLTGNPEVATHYYGYLRGFWKDGSRVTAGGNGLHGATPVDYMFPGDPGACGAASGWNELSEGNPADDRRFILSAGPFYLQNGAQNEIITGAVWAQGSQNAQLGSLCEVFSADDLAQALFDAKFHLLDGPDAPVVEIAEFDQELVIAWDYPDTVSFNNYQERYSQLDPALVSQAVSDPEFQFQGYMVFQLKDGGVSNSDLFDTDKSRLLAQCDIKDGVGTIVNRVETFIEGLDDPVLTDLVMVTGEDEGIFHSVRATEDLFAEGSDRRLRNYTNYYYSVIAYAWNGIPSDGRKFVQGNSNFENVTAMPHKTGFESNGSILSANFGDGIPVDQISGIGNGGNAVVLRPETETEILNSGNVSRIGYAAGASPIQLRVVNSKEIQKGNYRLEVVRNEPIGQPKAVFGLPEGTVTEQEMIEWKLFHEGAVVAQSYYMERRDSHGTVLGYRPEPLSGTERMIPGHGFAIGVFDPQASDLAQQGYDPVIAAKLQYKDPSLDWLMGYADIDRDPIADWIMAGIDTFDRGENLQILRDASIYDPEENYERLFEGSWAPMCLARGFNVNDLSGKVSPGINVGLGAVSFALKPDSMLNLSELPDIDIVFSPDPSKWSRCVVVETSPNNATGAGSNSMTAKWKLGLNAQLQPMPGVLDSATQGWSMFPGYAIDVNTGQRLNIFFGENDWDKVNHGGDLLWNPTSVFGSSGNIAGGRHYIYVSKTPYDGCAKIHEVLARETKLLTGSQMLFEPTYGPPWENPSYIAKVYKDVAWVGVPMVRPGFEWETYDQMPTEVRLSLRVNDPFRSRPGSGDIPVFLFNTDAYSPETNVVAEAERSLLQDVRVVPNPYYAFSEYERSPVQSIVKITNLPRRCNIKIFNLSGTMVRSYTKNSDSPEQIWDLKNHAGVPIASGAYLIHVDGFELGETIVKLFTVMPQMDLNSY